MEAFMRQTVLDNYDPHTFLKNIREAIKSSDNLLLEQESKPRALEEEASFLTNIRVIRSSIMDSNPLFRLKLPLCNQSVTEFMMLCGSLLKTHTLNRNYK
jgi:hypothetical protein